MISKEEELSKLSINERQCIAIICFERFCKKYQIKHNEITEFIEHIWKVADIEGILCDWIDKFSKLSITGLGDKIPSNIMEEIPKKLWEDFDRLTQYVVETSASCWFGAESIESKRMVLEIFKILKKHNIDIPKIKDYNCGNIKSEDGWIPKIEEERIKIWRLSV